MGEILRFEKKELDLYKVRFLAENVSSQNWKSAEDILQLLNDLEAKKGWEGGFLTDEKGLYTLLSTVKQYDIYSLDEFDVKRFIERRYETLPDAEFDVKYQPTMLFEVQLTKDLDFFIIFVMPACSTGPATLK